MRARRRVHVCGAVEPRLLPRTSFRFMCALVTSSMGLVMGRGRKRLYI